jgi:hypothetical protein
MTSVAPICHIPAEVVTNQPGPQNLPAIPPATANLQSLMHTVNALRQVVMFISGQQGPRGPQGAPGNNAKSKPARWTENSRTTTTVRIYQNNDKSSPNFVDVEQINGLTMQDGITGESWNWSR